MASPIAFPAEPQPGRGRRIALAVIGSVLVTIWKCRFGWIRGRARRIIIARQWRLFCERMGPTFAKLGQLASVRPDVFSPEAVFELERLQDRMPPVPFPAIRRAIVEALGADPDTLFASFEEAPLAAASVAQVHRARLRKDYRPVTGQVLPAGTELAIKVLRPGIESQIAADLAIARRWAQRMSRFKRLARWRPVELLEEFAAMLERELDFRNEGRIADRFARDFVNDERVIVPRVIWRHTTRRVLVTEYVEGWRLNDLGAAERAGIDARALATHGANVFMHQVLVLGYYHADMHPANLFVTPNGRICFLDFGIVGTTTSAQREAIAQVLVGLVYGDADRALRYSRELGLEIPEEQVTMVGKRVETLVRSHLLTKPQADVRGFALGFLSMLTDFRIPIPSGYGLLIKSLVTVEGVARAIYPDLDLMQAARPFTTRLIAEQLLQPDRLRLRFAAARNAALEQLLS
jgi:ubiquinone biosynthesis protein